MALTFGHVLVGSDRRPGLVIERPGRRAASATLGIAFLALLIDAIANPRAFFDLWAMQAIQGVDAPGLPGFIGAIERLTSSTGAVAAWALVLIAFAVTRRWAAAIVTSLMPVGGVLNTLVGEFLVERTRPHAAELERTSFNFEERSFPSGHVMGAVLLYGLIFVVAGRIAFRPLRLAIQGGSALVILASGFERVWEGAHWPTDVLGAYALGGLLLVGLVALEARLHGAIDGLPLIHAGAVAHDESRQHAHALTSVVLFDRQTVAKVYRPGLLPRLLYWAAYQAPFPYERNRAALRAATARRNLAALLTEYWYGTARVARIVGIERAPSGDSRFAVVSERVNGQAPADRRDAKAFLAGLRERFEAAGLPTWQIDPRQPRAVDNLLETAPGVYQIVDLESGLVSPLASVKTWRRAIRRAMVPIFDDVYADVTRAYVAREETAMTAALGEAWVTELHNTIDAGEAAAAEWHAGEPRLWHRLLTGFGLWGRVRSLKARTAGGQEKAQAWLSKAIDGWERDERISADEAATLRRQMQEPTFQAMLPYLGAHILISIPLRFPFGSIVRPVMVAGALGVATARLARRQISREQWKVAWSIHSPLVMLLAAVPGFGSFAYLGSKPIRANRLLLRVLADAALAKAPKNLYERSKLRRLVARPAGSANLTHIADARRVRATEESAALTELAWATEPRRPAPPATRRLNPVEQPTPLPLAPEYEAAAGAA